MRVLEGEYLGMGTEVQQFEEALSKYFGRSAVCVVNGTAALQLALQSCGIGIGDEVLVPSLTYIASFQAISATGAKPVACDISSETYLLDLSDAQKRITDKTKAIMPVHYTGKVDDLDAIYKFANKFNLRIIEDAAHAFGATYKERRIGSSGDVACFSFDGIKNITSGEGGSIVTDNEDVLRKVRDARLLGVEKDTDKRYLGKRSWLFDVNDQGWRYHMSNIMAAIGLVQLKRFAEFAEKRQELAKEYDNLLSDYPGIHLLDNDYDTIVPHIYVIRIEKMNNREKIQQYMLKKNIEVGYHYQPNHWLSLYKDDKALPLPVLDSIFPELLSLPIHPDLSKDDVNTVVMEIKNLFS